MKDPVVEQFRAVRQAHAERFEHNPTKICADFRQKQLKYKDRLVSLSPKRVKEKEIQQ